MRRSPHTASVPGRAERDRLRRGRPARPGSPSPGSPTTRRRRTGSSRSSSSNASDCRAPVVVALPAVVARVVLAACSSRPRAPRTRAPRPPSSPTQLDDEPGATASTTSTAANVCTPGTALAVLGRPGGEGTRAEDRVRPRRSSGRRGWTSTATAATPATTCSPVTSPTQWRPGTRARVVVVGTLADPFTGRTIAFAQGRTPRAVQIDHVVALSDAWQKGAQQLTADQRRDVRERPAQPARGRRRDANAQKGDWRRGDLAAQEQGVPLRVRRSRRSR